MNLEIMVSDQSTETLRLGGVGSGSLLGVRGVRGYQINEGSDYY